MKPSNLLQMTVLMFVACCGARAGDWPHWRGPARNDVVDEKIGDVAARWDSLPIAWKANVGEGSSSPIVAAGSVYAMGWRDGKDSVICLDARTGRELWKREYPCRQYGRRATGDETLYSGPTSTPEFDVTTKRLFTLSADGDLHCWDTNDTGKPVWRRNLYDDYAVPRRPRHGRSGLRDYGYTTAPFAWGNTVIVEVGDDEGALMAFDQQTGERVWTSEYRGPAGHSGGLTPLTVGGIPCVAVLTYQGLLVARLDAGHEGRTVAQVDWTTDFANNIATPAAEGNSVLITSAYNHQAIRRIDIGLSQSRQVWEQPFASKVCSPVIHGGRVYWAWQTARCLDFESGAEIWSGGSFADAGSCILTADQRLIIWGDHGKLALLDVSSGVTTYRELASRNHLARSDVWPHLAFANGRIYCKDREGHITCFHTGNE